MAPGTDNKLGVVLSLKKTQLTVGESAHCLKDACLPGMCIGYNACGDASPLRNDVDFHVSVFPQENLVSKNLVSQHEPNYSFTNSSEKAH